MDRLISEKAVLEAFREYQGSISDFYKAVKAIPSAEPKTGHWIVHPKGIYAHLVCDKCLSNAPYDCRTNYCPNCGARMVGEQKSEEKG